MVRWMSFVHEVSIEALGKYYGKLNYLQKQMDTVNYYGTSYIDNVTSFTR